MRILREAKRMTLIELSRASGLSAGYISRIERGAERTASAAATEALASALSVSVDHLAGQLPPWRPLRKILSRESRYRFALSVGLTEEELVEIEEGTRVPDESTRLRLAERLGVPAGALDGPRP